MDDGDLLPRLWATVGGDPALLERVTVTGPEHVLPSVFDVTGLAAASVATATLAVAELAAARRDMDVEPVWVGRRVAAAAFRSEALLAPSGWQMPPAWDRLAGDYRTADGWIRLHTNYSHHRAAALRALDLPADLTAELPDGDASSRETVARAVRRRSSQALEERVVAEGGCAAVMHTQRQWSEHPHGAAVRGEPPVTVSPAAGSVTPVHPRRAVAGAPPGAPGPLSGLRVLDLTRVIAGPVSTRTLAAWGASVLRVDPPGFAEVPALLPDMTTGKRCAALDLTHHADRTRFEALVGEADVVVHGLRPGALERLGYGTAFLRSLNPALVIAAVDAYGWTGPWAGRRGFDSLVQMSCGIAAAGAEAAGTEDGRPLPLPAQALDHGAGYLLAAGVCRALTRRARGDGPADVRASLVGVAGVLGSAPRADGPDREQLDREQLNRELLDRAQPVWLDADRVTLPTAWGPAGVVPCPGRIGAARAAWQVPAGPLGRDEPAFGP